MAGERHVDRWGSRLGSGTNLLAPAGQREESLPHAWADRTGQDDRIAFMSVRPGQHDAQWLWLALLRPGGGSGARLS